MALSMQEKFRRNQAKREKAAKVAEYKAGEHARRSEAARIAAAVRADTRLADVIAGKAEPRNAREQRAYDREFYGFED